MPFRKNYTDDDIRKNASEVYSLTGLLKSLGMVQAGGNFSTMKKKIQTLSIDTSHWTGKGWNANQQLKDWAEYKNNSALKKHLIGLRGNTCENCLNSVWMNQFINLEVHHIDGNRTNNNLNNLQLLCPNCHSMTKNWRGGALKGKDYGKKIKPIKIHTAKILNPKIILCSGCGSKLHKDTKTGLCKSCYIVKFNDNAKERGFNSRKVKNRPSKQELLDLLGKYPYTTVGKMYGVSDNAIRKWLK